MIATLRWLGILPGPKGNKSQCTRIWNRWGYRRIPDGGSLRDFVRQGGGGDLGNHYGLGACLASVLRLTVLYNG